MTFLTNIQAYSEHCANIACSKPFHISSPDIFRVGDIFKILWSFDQVYSERFHSENSLFRYYSAKFGYIQNLLEPSHIQKPVTFIILEYSGPFHNCLPSSLQNPITFTKIGKFCVALEIQNLCILIILEYLESCHI